MIHYRYQREYFDFEVVGGNDKYIKLLEFKSVRETKHGYWLKLNNYKEKFVLKKSKNRFAYPTKKEAFENFRRRTIRSFHFSMASVENAKTFVELINKHELNEKQIKL